MEGESTLRIAVFALLLLVGCEQKHFNSFAETRAYLNELDEFQEAQLLKSEQISDKQEMSAYRRGSGILFVSIKKEEDEYVWESSDSDWDFAGDGDFFYELLTLDGVHVLFGKVLSEHEIESISLGGEPLHYDPDSQFFFAFSEEPFVVEEENVELTVFAPRKDPSEFTRTNAPFKPEFSGYKFTQKEIQDLRAGGKVMVTAKSKKGKSFTCNVSHELKEFKGKKFWGLETHFG